MLLMLLPLVGVGQTSVYHPMPESDAVWSVYQAIGTPDPNWCTVIYNYPIVISGDTTIQSNVYKRLETPYYLDSSVGNNCQGISAPVYHGAFRQDIPNKQVFYVGQSDTVETLLYDFNLQVGDTIVGSLSLLPVDHIITSMDSVLVGNSFRKRWTINETPFYSIIEGVGSTFGLLPSFGGFFTHEPYFEVTCFQEGGTMMYPESPTSCLTITDVATEPQKASLHLYPNPTTSTINIQLPENNGKATRTRIYDMTGRLVHQQPFNPNMDVGYLDRGTYIVVVKTEDGNFRGTVQKQ